LTDTVTDPYFVNAIEGKEYPGGLLVRPHVEPSLGDVMWEAWVPCGQTPGGENDLLYKSRWYRRASVGPKEDMLLLVQEEHVPTPSPIHR